MQCHDSDYSKRPKKNEGSSTTSKWQPRTRSARRSVGATAGLGISAIPELLRRLTEVERVEHQRDVEIVRPQRDVLLLGERRVVVDVPAEDRVAECDVVLRVHDRDVPEVIQPLPHGEDLVWVDRDEVHESLELDLHLVDVSSVVVQTVDHVLSLSRHVPGSDLLPEKRLTLIDTQWRDKDLRIDSHSHDTFHLV